MQEEQKKLRTVDKQLLRRYFNSASTEADKQVILDWFICIQAEQELREVSRELWDEMMRYTDTQDYDEARLHEIHYLLRLEEARDEQKSLIKKRFVKYLTRIAAVLFIPLSIFTFYYLTGNTAGDKLSATAEIYSPLGARTRFTLPDGSSGWLNCGSYLSFPTEFTGKSRDVELVGEAYFNVEEDPGMPFAVFTDGIEVKAYGTSFNVMAYPNDKKIEVTLESGNVRIIGQDNYGRDLIIDELLPRTRGVIFKETNLYQIYEVSVDKYISWKDGKLVFKNEPMVEVIKRINRWYSVNLIIKDKRLESFSYRATFVDETLDEVLNLIQMSSPLTYKDLGRERYPDGTYGKRTIELYYSPS